MNLDDKNLLTPNELTFLLIGIMMDISVTSLPNSVIANAKQDGWISVLLGAIYPLYVALLAIYLSNKFPKENILIISKKTLGKPLGTTLNLLFMLSFLSYLPGVVSSIAIIVRTDILQVITPLKIYIVFLLASVYAASKGIKLLGRVSSISFLMIIGIILPTIAILKEGSILNLQPIKGVGVLNIIKDAKASSYDYSLLELVFLIYPFINDSKKIKPAVLKAVGFTCLIYTWITFITIYYLGINIIPKTIWSFITVTEGVKLEILNNFRYIIISYWIFIALKSAAIFNFVYMFILDDIKKIKNKNYVYFFVSSAVIIITLVYFKDYTAQDKIKKYTSSISIIYNLLYISLICVAAKARSWRKNEKI